MFAWSECGVKRYEYSRWHNPCDCSDMQYSDVFDLALRLEALGKQGIRTAEAHAFRIWRARSGWGSTPSDETWAGIFKTAERAQKWLRAYEENGAEEFSNDDAVTDEHGAEAATVAIA